MLTRRDTCPGGGPQAATGPARGLGGNEYFGVCTTNALSGDFAVTAGFSG